MGGDGVKRGRRPLSKKAWFRIPPRGSALERTISHQRTDWTTGAGLVCDDSCFLDILGCVGSGVFLFLSLTLAPAVAGLPDLTALRMELDSTWPVWSGAGAIKALS